MKETTTYTTPEVDVFLVSVEEGFSLSTGVKDWEEGSTESGDAE